MTDPLFIGGLVVSRPRPAARRRLGPVAGSALFHLTLGALAATAPFLAPEVIPPPAASADAVPIVWPLPANRPAAAGGRTARPGPRGGGASGRARAAVRPRAQTAPPLSQPLDPLPQPAGAAVDPISGGPSGPGWPDGSGPEGDGSGIGCAGCEGDGSGPGPGTAGEDIVDESDPRIVLPVILPASRAVPRYPDLARRARIGGSVILLITIAEDGGVGEIEVLQGSDPRWGFDLAAVEAVKRWRYRPGLLDGRPVSVRARVIVEFTLSR